MTTSPSAAAGAALAGVSSRRPAAAAADGRGSDDAPAADLAALPGSGQLGGGQAARPQLIRALNEQLMLSHIRRLGPCSRADLARLSGLSKPTVSLALVNV